MEATGTYGGGPRSACARVACAELGQPVPASRYLMCRPGTQARGRRERELSSSAKGPAGGCARRYTSVKSMVDELKIEPAVETFAEIAQRYCSWAASPSGEPRDEMLTARKLLAELHRAAIDLPGLGPGEDTEEVNRLWNSNLTMLKKFSGVLPLR